MPSPLARIHRSPRPAPRRRAGPRPAPAFALLFFAASVCAEPLDYAELQLLGASEFMRLAEDRWEAADYRASVTFANKARRIRTEALGRDDPEVARIASMIDAALAMLEKGRDDPAQRVLLLQTDDLKKLARSEDADAFHELGIRYANGYGGLERDLIIAVSWFERAASRGRADSMFELGKAFVEQRIREELAARWATDGPVGFSNTPPGGLSPIEFRLFNEAHKLGHEGARAFVALALIDQALGAEDEAGKSDSDEGWKMMRQGMREGNIWAQYLLASALSEGFGITANRTLALREARKASAQGMKEAQLLLADLTLPEEGSRPARNSRTEGWVALYCAAEQDNWFAFYPLGLRLATGNGIEKDVAVARMWLRKAADEGHVPAGTALFGLQ